MSNTLLGALKSLFCLNRWNVEPRIEIWTEAENIAFCSHFVYAIGRRIGMPPAELKAAVTRSILKSINKHYLSDISVHVRDYIRSKNEKAWKSIVNEAATETSKLFPNDLKKFVESYLSLDGSYEAYNPELVPDKKARIENLIKFAQYQTALIEIEPNEKAFPENEGYKTKKEEINNKIQGIGGVSEFQNAYAELKGYIFTIRNLKHVRRWNRTNRTIESSVLAHTFLVSILAVIFSEKCKQDVKTTDGVDFSYHAVLLALFHDVPEMLTGDIITPVKTIIARHDPKLLENMEEDLCKKLQKTLPERIQDDIELMKLFVDPSKSEAFSVSSLVI